MCVCVCACTHVCVYVCVKACDYQYGERTIKMLSGKFDGEGNQREKKKSQKGKEKRRETRSLFICCISVTNIRATPKPASPIGRSHGFEKPAPPPSKTHHVSFELCSDFLLIPAGLLKLPT